MKNRQPIFANKVSFNLKETNEHISIWLLNKIAKHKLKRFWIEWHKIKTKAITVTNQNEGKYH